MSVSHTAMIANVLGFSAKTFKVRVCDAVLLVDQPYLLACRCSLVAHRGEIRAPRRYWRSWLSGHPQRTSAPSVAVVLPCLNEVRNLPYVFSRMPAGVAEVVLVDGGSTDGSVECAVDLWPKVVVVHQTRTGKGNALACGFAACTSDIIVMLDGDGSTDPAEIPRFVAALTAGADFAKGSRFLPGGASHDITRLRRLGNDGLCAIVNGLFRTDYSDLCYGYNAFWHRVLPHLDLPDPGTPAPADRSMLWGDGFEVETLINIRAAVSRLRVTEVPSVEAARLHGVSNLNAYGDGRRVLSMILREYRSRRTRAKAVRRRLTERAFGPSEP
jgi:glycosyltransferase involved in cell wall biosynthesis